MNFFYIVCLDAGFMISTERILGLIVIRGLETGANLVYEVEYQGKEFLIPDAPGVVLELDLEARKLVIDPVPGLFDDDEVQKKPSSKSVRG